MALNPIVAESTFFRHRHDDDLVDLVDSTDINARTTGDQLDLSGPALAFVAAKMWPGASGAFDGRRWRVVQVTHEGVNRSDTPIKTSIIALEIKP